MLQYLIKVTETSFAPAVVLALAMAAVAACGRADRRGLLFGLGAGTLIALVYAVLKLNADYAAAVYAFVTDVTGMVFRERYMVREYYNLAVLFPAIPIVLLGAALVPATLGGSGCPNRAGRFLLALTLTIAAACAAPDLFLYPFEFAAGLETVFNADVFYKAAGYVCALALIGLLVSAVSRIGAALPHRLLAGFLLLALLVYAGLLGVDLAQGLFARTRLLKDHAGTVIWLMVHAPWFVYALTALAAAMALRLLVGARLTPIRGGNPAEVRKAKARVRRLTRWSLFGLFLLAVVLFVLTWVKDYANRPIEISPATPVAPVAGRVSVPLPEVEDGRLHRFVFKASDGTEVRFLIIRKSSNAYGVGLDACDICGASGYYQRGEHVICNRCDVAMNIATIGFPGGCNPVPLPFTIPEGSISIDAADLEKEKRRFR